MNRLHIASVLVSSFFALSSVACAAPGVSAEQDGADPGREGVTRFREATAAGANIPTPPREKSLAPASDVSDVNVTAPNPPPPAAKPALHLTVTPAHGA